ncbi:MAG: FG-GAP repeat protein, partial [Planctomycetes bacterium]|nr:FG-GAP repeat protein [Planctomycetota bacterium]
MKLSNALFLSLGFLLPAAMAHASDFNGDGRADLTMAVQPTFKEGVVHVLFGTAGGLTSSGMQTLVAQTTPVISYPAVDTFGTAIAAGDFDHDGFDDLAVSVPYAWFKDVAAVGCVNVFRGTPNGLVPAGVLHQNKGGMKDKCELGDVFGWALTSGDFDHDGYDDLAIGVMETIGKFETAGAVHVVYGSKKGLTGKKDQFWTQNSKGVEGIAEVDDAFGSVLAAGDADGDGYDDLAIGIPYESTDHGGIEVEGAVALLRG